MANPKRRGPAARPKQRRTPGKRPSQVSAETLPGVESDDVIESASTPPPRVSTRSRRVPIAASRAYALPRSVEYAYIRSDLQRLVVIAGGLLALMLIMLVVVNR